jgi:hypothetical protein
MRTPCSTNLRDAAARLCPERPSQEDAPAPVADNDRAEPPNPGDPGPEMPEPRRPLDPAEDPRLPVHDVPRGI